MTFSFLSRRFEYGEAARRTEERAHEKYPKLLRKQKTRGSNAEGGNFSGNPGYFLRIFTSCVTSATAAA